MSDCIFCKIIHGEIPSTKIYEDDEFYAFKDLNPQAPVHFLVVPKKHITSLMELEESDSPLMGRLLYRAQLLAKQEGLGEGGARFDRGIRKEPESLPRIPVPDKEGSRRVRRERPPHLRHNQDQGRGRGGQHDIRAFLCRGP